MLTPVTPPVTSPSATQRIVHELITYPATLLPHLAFRNAFPKPFRELFVCVCVCVSFFLAYVVNFIGVLYFWGWVWVTIQCPFISAWTLCSFSWRAILLMRNLLFCFFFFFKLAMSEFLLGYGILGWQSFSFSALNMLFYCFLASIVSDEKSAVNFI